MRYRFLILVIAFFPQLCSSQITHFGNLNLKTAKFDDSISNRTAWKFLNEFNKRKHHVFSEQQMLNVTRRKDLNLTELDKLYNENIWVNIADYMYLDPPSYKYLSQNYSVKFNDKINGEAEFDFKSHYYSETENPYMYSRGPMVKNHLQFVKIGGYTYLKKAETTNDQKTQYDHQNILTFTKDYIIIEFTHSGKPGDFTSKRRFRNQLISIPKSLFFSSDGREINDYAYSPDYNNSQENISELNQDQLNYQIEQAEPNFSESEGYLSYNGSDTRLPIIPTIHYAPNTKLNSESANIYYSNAIYLNEFIPDAQMLRQMRPSTSINEKLGNDIYDFDFIELARYEWYNGEHFIKNDSYFEILRFHPQQGIHSFTLKYQNLQPNLTYNNNHRKDIVRVKKSGPFYRLTNSKSGENKIEYLIVSYENDVLIIDQIDAITNSKFRIVYGAIAQSN